MLVGGAARHFLYRVFAQDVVSATASPGSATADRKRDAEPAEDDAAAGEDRHSSGFAFAAAIRAKRAACRLRTT